MNTFLQQKHPYLSDYFDTAINQNRLFHSIIMYGGNIYRQYAIALELARQLNCLEDKRPDCNCQNCKWIRENKHPSVMTVSKIDNKNDDSKTVISVGQVNALLDTLVSSSDYHRVFIFCDAEIKELSQEEQTEYEEFKMSGFQPPQTVDNGKVWYPNGLTMKVLQKESANSMLKSIEEPPAGVTFIFLTNDTTELISTIVSRSQAFYVPDTKFISYDTDFFKRYFENYPSFNKTQALDFAQALLTFQTEKDCSPLYVIDCLQYYLNELLKSNFENKVLFNKIIRDIKKIEHSKKMLKTYIKEQTVYEDLAFYFSS